MLRESLHQRLAAAKLGSCLPPSLYFLGEALLLPLLLSVRLVDSLLAQHVLDHLLQVAIPMALGSCANDLARVHERLPQPLEEQFPQHLEDVFLFFKMKQIKKKHKWQIYQFRHNEAKDKMSYVGPGHEITLRALASHEVETRSCPWWDLANLVCVQRPLETSWTIP